ncbi:MAG: YciI family protein [Calditrichia bacterium]
MRFVLFFLAIATLACSVEQKTDTAESGEPTQPAEVVQESTYNPELAAKYGADNYGMRKYVMAFLKRGPNRPTDEKKSAQLQAAHMKNIGRMAEAGKLSLAGPFLNDGELRGIYIFNVETVEEAKALTETDPAIQHGSLVMELVPWYGSAALMGVNEVHKTLSKVEM